MKWQDAVPILLSILVIIVVAVVQKYSKLAAAVTATMPLTAPLALWVVYTLNDGDKAATVQITENMLVGVVPTVAFLVAAWLSARAGIRLVPMILIGYGAWAVVLILSVSLRNFLAG